MVRKRTLTKEELEEELSEQHGNVPRLKIKSFSLRAKSSFDKLSDIPPALTKLNIVNLVSLDLSNNALRKLPLNCQLKFKHLQSLNLSQNQFEEFVEQDWKRVFVLPVLRHFDLSFNQLERIPSWFSQLFPTLHSLDLRRNRLCNLADFRNLVDLVNLIDLNVLHNPICVSEVDKYQRLIEDSEALLNGSHTHLGSTVGIPESMCRSYAIFLLHIKRFNGGVVTNEEVETSKKLHLNDEITSLNSLINVIQNERDQARNYAQEMEMKLKIADKQLELMRHELKRAKREKEGMSVELEVQTKKVHEQVRKLLDDDDEKDFRMLAAASPNSNVVNLEIKSAKLENELKQVTNKLQKKNVELEDLRLKWQNNLRDNALCKLVNNELDELPSHIAKSAQKDPFGFISPVAQNKDTTDIQRDQWLLSILRKEAKEWMNWVAKQNLVEETILEDVWIPFERTIPQAGNEEILRIYRSALRSSITALIDKLKVAGPEEIHKIEELQHTVEVLNRDLFKVRQESSATIALLEQEFETMKEILEAKEERVRIAMQLSSLSLHSNIQ